MRRCTVTSCPFVAVLLLTFGGAACEDIGMPAASCYYEEKGVTKSCEHFEEVACKVVGSYSNTPCDSQITYDIYEPKYFNATLQMWNTIGYLIVEGAECWRLITGGRQFPEDCVTVKLNYVPCSNETNIALRADVDGCAYFRDSLYTLQVFRGTNGTFGIDFTFKTPPEIERVLLELWHGECEITCNSTTSKCDTELTEERNMTNFTARVYFTGLEEGYYCMTIYHGRCIIHTYTYGTPKRLPDSTPAPTDSPKDDSILLLVSLSIAGTALIVILAIFLKRRSYGTVRQLLDTEEEEMPTQWQSVHQQWVSSPDTHTELLLLYSRDCREFCDVMQAFSQLLKRFGNMTVLDPMEQNQMEEVSENISGWLAQHLRNPDVKVVIVVSEGAKRRQRALLNNQIVHIANPHFLDSIYTQALQQMHEDPNLGSNYTRIFPVRFEDFTPSEESLSLIVPLICYVLPKHLGKLIFELKGSNTPNGPDLEDIRNIFPYEVDQLESTIKIMKSYCSVNPHYISKHFSLVVPSTLTRLDCT